jgi:hypothetical protein
VIKFNANLEIKSSLTESSPNICFDYQLLSCPVAFEEENYRPFIVIEWQFILPLSFQDSQIVTNPVVERFA